MAVEPETGWTRRLRTGLCALLACLDEQPGLARILVVEQPEPPEGAPALLARALAPVLDAARVDLIVGFEPQPSALLICELVAAGLHSCIRTALANEPSGGLQLLAASLFERIVEPYLGRGAARVDTQAERRGAVDEVPTAQVVPIRATRQHLAALAALAEGGALRNCELAEAARLSGSGEASQLLKRLCDRGLAERIAAGCEAPRWSLTSYGGLVLRCIGGPSRGAHEVVELDARRAA